MIGIIDVDRILRKTNFPNLALMKISGFYRAQGFETRLVYTPLEAMACERCFASKVFSDPPAASWILQYPRGGTGFPNENKPLDDAIEHTRPDYDLYGVDFGLGFTTRGCFRRCPFCVNRDKTRVEKWSPVKEFDDPTRKYLIMLDDNIFGYPQWRDVFDELEETGKPFQYKQGLDMRLMTDEKARALQRARYRKEPTFALDKMEDATLFEEKASVFRRFCDKEARAYLLTGYYDSDWQAIANLFARIELLKRYDILPYVMRYETVYKSALASVFASIAAWTNQPRFFRKTSFRQFCELRGVKKTLELLTSAPKELCAQFDQRGVK